MELPVMETDIFSLAPQEAGADLSQMFTDGPLTWITTAFETAKEGDLTYLTLGTAVLAVLAAIFWLAFFIRRSRFNKKQKQLETLKKRQERRRRWEEEERRYRESQGPDYDYDEDDYEPEEYPEDDVDEELEKWASDSSDEGKGTGKKQNGNKNRF